MQNYYGIFGKNPQKFHFLRGHRKLLEQVVDFTKQQKEKHGYKFFKLDDKNTCPKACMIEKMNSKVSHNKSKLVGKCQNQNIVRDLEGETKESNEHSNKDFTNVSGSIEMNEEQSTVYKNIKEILIKKFPNFYAKVSQIIHYFKKIYLTFMN